MILNVPLIAGTGYPETTVGAFSLANSEYRRVTSVIQFSKPGVYLVYSAGYTIRSATGVSQHTGSISKPGESQCTIKSHGQGRFEVTVPTTADTIAVTSTRSSSTASVFVRLLVAGPGIATLSTTYSTTS